MPAMAADIVKGIDVAVLVADEEEIPPKHLTRMCQPASSKGLILASCCPFFHTSRVK
jgi:hypothetical protein